MFELYFMGEHEASVADQEDVVASVRRALADADVIIVADYGHGMISGAVVDQLVESRPFLVVNTQANAGNRGLRPRATGHSSALVPPT